jgi:hypothetical protein
MLRLSCSDFDPINGLGAVHTNTPCGVEVHIDLVDAPTENGK